MDKAKVHTLTDNGTILTINGPIGEQWALLYTWLSLLPIFFLSAATGCLPSQFNAACPLLFSIWVWKLPQVVLLPLFRWICRFLAHGTNNVWLCLFPFFFLSGAIGCRLPLLCLLAWWWWWFKVPLSNNNGYWLRGRRRQHQKRWQAIHFKTLEALLRCLAPVLFPFTHVVAVKVGLTVAKRRPRGPWKKCGKLRRELKRSNGHYKRDAFGGRIELLPKAPNLPPFWITSLNSLDYHPKPVFSGLRCPCAGSRLFENKDSFSSNIFSTICTCVLSSLIEEVHETKKRKKKRLAKEPPKGLTGLKFLLACLWNWVHHGSIYDSGLYGCQSNKTYIMKTNVSFVSGFDDWEKRKRTKFKFWSLLHTLCYWFLLCRALLNAMGVSNLFEYDLRLYRNLPTFLGYITARNWMCWIQVLYTVCYWLLLFKELGNAIGVASGFEFQLLLQICLRYIKKARDWIRWIDLWTLLYVRAPCCLFFNYLKLWACSWIDPIIRWARKLMAMATSISLTGPGWSGLYKVCYWFLLCRALLNAMGVSNLFEFDLWLYRNLLLPTFLGYITARNWMRWIQVLYTVCYWLLLFKEIGNAIGVASGFEFQLWLYRNFLLPAFLRYIKARDWIRWIDLWTLLYVRAPCCLFFNYLKLWSWSWMSLNIVDPIIRWDRKFMAMATNSIPENDFVDYFLIYDTVIGPTLGGVAPNAEAAIASTLDEARHGNKNIQIFVKLLDGTTAVVSNLNHHDTILSVKKKLASTTKASIEDQRLLFGGNKLRDSLTLMDYNIQNESSLELSGSLLGGAGKKGTRPSRTMSKGALCDIGDTETLKQVPTMKERMKILDACDVLKFLHREAERIRDYTETRDAIEAHIKDVVQCILDDGEAIKAVLCDLSNKAPNDLTPEWLERTRIVALHYLLGYEFQNYLETSSATGLSGEIESIESTSLEPMGKKPCGAAQRVRLYRANHRATDHSFLRGQRAIVDFVLECISPEVAPVLKFIVTVDRDAGAEPLISDKQIRVICGISDKSHNRSIRYGRMVSLSEIKQLLISFEADLQTNYDMALKALGIADATRPSPPNYATLKERIVKTTSLSNFSTMTWFSTESKELRNQMESKMKQIMEAKPHHVASASHSPVIVTPAKRSVAKKTMRDPKDSSPKQLSMKLPKGHSTSADDECTTATEDFELQKHDDDTSKDSEILHEQDHDVTASVEDTPKQAGATSSEPATGENHNVTASTPSEPATGEHHDVAVSVEDAPKKAGATASEPATGENRLNKNEGEAGHASNESTCNATEEKMWREAFQDELHYAVEVIKAQYDAWGSKISKRMRDVTPLDRAEKAPGKYVVETFEGFERETLVTHDTNIQKEEIAISLNDLGMEGEEAKPFVVGQHNAITTKYARYLWSRVTKEALFYQPNGSNGRCYRVASRPGVGDLQMKIGDKTIANIEALPFEVELMDLMTFAVKHCWIDAINEQLAENGSRYKMPPQPINMVHIFVGQGSDGAYSPHSDNCESNTSRSNNVRFSKYARGPLPLPSTMIVASLVLTDNEEEEAEVVWELKKDGTKKGTTKTCSIKTGHNSMHWQGAGMQGFDIKHGSANKNASKRIVFSFRFYLTPCDDAEVFKEAQEKDAAQAKSHVHVSKSHYRLLGEETKGSVDEFRTNKKSQKIVELANDTHKKYNKSYIDPFLDRKKNASKCSVKVWGETISNATVLSKVVKTTQLRDKDRLIFFQDYKVLQELLLQGYMPHYIFHDADKPVPAFLGIDGQELLIPGQVVRYHDIIPSKKNKRNHPVFIGRGNKGNHIQALVGHYQYKNPSENAARNHEANRTWLRPLLLGICNIDGLSDEIYNNPSDGCVKMVLSGGSLYHAGVSQPSPGAMNVGDSHTIANSSQVFTERTKMIYQLSSRNQPVAVFRNINTWRSTTWRSKLGNKLGVRPNMHQVPQENNDELLFHGYFYVKTMIQGDMTMEEIWELFDLCEDYWVDKKFQEFTTYLFNKHVVVELMPALDGVHFKFYFKCRDQNIEFKKLYIPYSDKRSIFDDDKNIEESRSTEATNKLHQENRSEDTQIGNNDPPVPADAAIPATIKQPLKSKRLREDDEVDEVAELHEKMKLLKSQFEKQWEHLTAQLAEAEAKKTSSMEPLSDGGLEKLLQDSVRDQRPDQEGGESKAHELDVKKGQVEGDPSTIPQFICDMMKSGKLKDCRVDVSSFNGPTEHQKNEVNEKFYDKERALRNRFMQQKTWEKDYRQDFEDETLEDYVKRFAGYSTKFDTTIDEFVRLMVQMQAAVSARAVGVGGFDEAQFAATPLLAKENDVESSYFLLLLNCLRWTPTPGPFRGGDVNVAHLVHCIKQMANFTESKLATGYADIFDIEDKEEQSKKKEVLKRALIMAIVHRQTGRPIRFEEFGEWLVKNKQRQAKEGGCVPSNKEELKLFAEFLKETYGHDSLGTDAGKFKSKQHILSLLDNTKSVQELINFLECLDERVEAFLEIFQDPDKRKRSEAVEALKTLLMRASGSSATSKAANKRAAFLASMVLADLEEVFDQPFGEVTEDSIFSGPGGKDGKKFLREGGMTEKERTLENILNEVSGKLLKSKSGKQICDALGLSCENGELRWILNGRKLNMVDMEHWCCKLHIGIHMSYCTRNDSDQPIPHKHYCTPAKTLKIVEALEVMAKHTDGEDSSTMKSWKSFLQEHRTWEKASVEQHHQKCWNGFKALFGACGEDALAIVKEIAVPPGKLMHPKDRILWRNVTKLMLKDDEQKALYGDWLKSPNKTDAEAKEDEDFCDADDVVDDVEAAAEVVVNAFEAQKTKATTSKGKKFRRKSIAKNGATKKKPGRKRIDCDDDGDDDDAYLPSAKMPALEKRQPNKRRKIASTTINYVEESGDEDNIEEMEEAEEGVDGEDGTEEEKETEQQQRQGGGKIR